MSKIYIATDDPEDWKPLLLDPDKQWVRGFSARTLAYCWERANGLPNEIASMLRPYGTDVELLLAIPEYKVPLPPRPDLAPSQNDVFALARAGLSTFAIMIEGKVNEPFGEQLGDWLRNASDGKRERLAFICDQLGLALPPPDHIHYQLLHRTASAVIEARRFKTDAAAMIVHSFSPERRSFEAFKQFAALFGVAAEAVVANELIGVRPSTRHPLYIGWACGDCSFLRA